jgi:uncharacterized protein (TIGR03437 family)
MSSSFRAAGLLFVVGSVLSAQTAVVFNAVAPTVSALSGRLGYASFLLLGSYPTPNIVAPGMLAGLSYSSDLSVASPPPLPATVSIRPSGSNTPIRVEVASISPGSVTFVVPRNMPLGGAEIEYKPEGQPTAWTNVNVVPASFEFYRIGAGGPVTAQAVAPNGSLSPMGLTTPAQPGQTIRLTGSGLGNNTSVTVTVGGVPATVVHAQPHRAQPGLDEILVQIPPGLAVPDGCYVPLALTYNNTTVTSTMSKTSNGAPCVHPFQLSVADMKTLDSGGILNTGQIDMSTSLQVAIATAASRNEAADVSVTQSTATDIATYFSPVSSTGCTTNQLLGTPSFLAGNFSSSNPFMPPNLAASMSLQNAATTLALTGGPEYYSATLPQPTEGPLTNPPPAIITGGDWTWSSIGGPDLAASSFTFTLPAPFQLNGTAPVTLVRNQDQTIKWNGAAFGSGATLNAILTGASSVSCSVPASAGALTIPAAILAQFAANSLGTLELNITESGSSLPHALFKLQNGSTLLMLVNYTASETLPVDFQ